MAISDVMGSFNAFLLTYVLGGLTLLPLVLGLLFLYAYITLPHHSPDQSTSTRSTNPIRREDDDGTAFISETATPAKQFHRGHEPDVAEGYFAVCREYVPGGVNGKPPERTTPAGEVIAEESPSVYQSMYRNFFDRRQAPTLENNKGNGKSTKKARNIFYVVLRHGHLMLYDDFEQVEVRHVISLAYHDVSIYSGGNEIPEGELWIKRNAIRLTRKWSSGDVTSTSKPFFLFSENCSDKEDFYFALLHNQDRNPGDPASPPRAQHFEMKDIMSLVQRLHSSEEHLQTRWVNAIVGRLFLTLYKTQEIEDFVRMKITKKIARVKKPAFLSGIILQKIDLGEAAPHITNPHLKDLMVDGDCCVEADFKYAGNFKLEIAATARIDLGTRFKAREVHLVLAAVVKRLEGHVLLRIKPPPSNRVWISFESMPHIEMTIEPIVSSRQVTYGIILRAIESRIREVIAETIVLPHWDDSPFLNTMQQRFRGGIWAENHCHSGSPSRQRSMPDEDADHEVEGDLSGFDSPDLNPIKDERSSNIPSLADSSSMLTTQKGHNSNHSTESTDFASSAGPRKRPEPPKAMRSPSVASTAHPIVSMDHANVEAVNYNGNSKRPKDAARIMTEITHRPQPNSPLQTPVGSLNSRRTSFFDAKKNRSVSSASSSRSSLQDIGASQITVTNDGERFHHFSTALISSEDKIFIPEPEKERAASVQSFTRALNLDKRQSFPAIGAVAAVAKKWGWNAITRSTQQAKNTTAMSEAEREGTPAHPIGRGRPLPPPGQPLPRPDKRKSTLVAIPKRKSSPPPLLPSNSGNLITRSSKPGPPLPQRPAAAQDRGQILVVEALSTSEPTSPLDDGFGEFIDNVNEEIEKDIVIPSTTSTVLTENVRTLPTSQPTSSHLPGMHDEDDSSDLRSSRAMPEEEADLRSLWTEHQERL